MRFRRCLIALLTIVSLLLSAAGCGQKASEKTSSGGGGVGKTITFGLAQWPTNLDPAAEYNGWYVLEFGLGETLFKIDKGMEIKPWLAESWKRVDDLSWEIKIRDNVFFHNNKKVDGKAVKASLERSLRMNKRAPELLDIASIEAEGNEITVKTNHPNPALLNALADPLTVIVDAEAASAMGDAFAMKPILTGPFKLKEYDKDMQVVVERNNNYWGERPKLEMVTFKRIPDANTRIMALQAGEVQVANNIPAESLEAIKKSRSFRTLSWSSVRVHMLIFNVKKPGLDDISVRKAINMAINREDLADKVMKGSGIPAVGPYPLVLPFGGNELKGYSYRPEEARKLLDSAGWKVGPDGIRQKNGKKLEFTVITYQSRPELPVLLEAIQAELRDIGIKINITVVENINDALKGDFDAALYSMNTAPTADPQYLLEIMFKTGASSNFGKYSNPRLDALIDQLKTAFDKKKRCSIARDAQQILLDDAAFAFVVYPKTIVAMSNKVKGIAPSPTEYYLLTPEVTVEP